jgi:hypothetical protein
LDALVPLLVGFVLTTVVGGFLGVIFQRRLWSHQHDVQVRDLRHDSAMKIFEEVSRLLDRRLYRHKRLYWAFLELKRDGHLPNDAPERMDDYAQVVRDWNDGVNRNLALVEHFFGRDMRDELDNKVGSLLVRLGQLQESAWRKITDEGEPDAQVDLREQEDLITQASNKIYRYNLALLRAGNL